MCHAYTRTNRKILSPTFAHSYSPSVLLTIGYCSRYTLIESNSRKSFGKAKDKITKIIGLMEKLSFHRLMSRIDMAMRGWRGPKQKLCNQSFGI